MTKSLVAGFAVAAVTLCLVPNRASAAIVGFTGTGGFVAVGGVGNVNGCFPVACDSGFVAFNSGALLADGMNVQGLVRQTVLEDAFGNTVSAMLRVTNIVATNFGAGVASDTFFVVSDIFNPSLAGNAGVGIVGSFQSVAGVGGNVAASTQAQMNYLSNPIGGLGAPIVSFALTTVSPFVNCVACSPIGFFASAFVNNAPGGIVQLVGAINFTAAPGSQIVLPGSLILESNDEAAITSEAPEPGTLLLMGGMLLGVCATRKLRRG